MVYKSILPSKQTGKKKRLKDPTLDGDPGAAGHLPQGILSQTGVGPAVLWQGILDVELSHASLTDGVSKLDGPPCRGKHRRDSGQGAPAGGGIYQT